MDDAIGTLKVVESNAIFPILLLLIHAGSRIYFLGAIYFSMIGRCSRRFIV